MSRAVNLRRIVSKMIQLTKNQISPQQQHLGSFLLSIPETEPCFNFFDNKSIIKNYPLQLIQLVKNLRLFRNILKAIYNFFHPKGVIYPDKI